MNLKEVLELLKDNKEVYWEDFYSAISRTGDTCIEDLRWLDKYKYDYNTYRLATQDGVGLKVTNPRYIPKPWMGKSIEIKFNER